MKLGPGSVVADRYRIERELGRGGMGSVWVATDLKFNERVALKVAAAAGAAHTEFRERFRREAKIGHRLGKAAAGFVRAIDWGELPDGLRLFLAMDLVEDAVPLDLSSGTVAERLQRLAHAASLVAEAHSHGILHRDIKPANFLQAPDGAIFLTDFGLAKMQGEPEEETGTEEGLTQSGVGMGTPNYMAPEQFDDARTVDGSADVFSLGVMLFKALTGQHPFPGSDFRQIWAAQEKVRTGALPRPSPRQHAPQVSAGLDTLCARAIALERSERPDSEAFRRGLADALASLGDAPSAQVVVGSPTVDSHAATVPPPAAPSSPPPPPPPTAPTRAQASRPPRPPQPPPRPARPAPPTAQAVAAPGPRRKKRYWLAGALSCGALGLFGCCLTGILFDLGGESLAGATAQVHARLPGRLARLADRRAPEVEVLPGAEPVDWTARGEVTLSVVVRDTSLDKLQIAGRRRGFPRGRYRILLRHEFRLPRPGRYEVPVIAIDRAGRQTTTSYTIWRVDRARLIEVRAPRWVPTAQARVEGRLVVRVADEVEVNGQARAVDEQGRFAFSLRLRRGPNEALITVRPPRDEPPVERRVTIIRR